MKKLIVTVNGKPYEVEIELPDGSDFIEQNSAQSRPRYSPPISPRTVAGAYSRGKADAAARAKTSGSDGNSLNAPFNGIILEVNAKIGKEVQEGEVLFVFEAMKMKTNVSSPRAGKISEIYVNAGDTVESGKLLLKYE